MEITKEILIFWSALQTKIGKNIPNHVKNLLQ